MTHLQDNPPKIFFAIGGIFVFLLIIYSNTFHAAFVFDDFPDIVDRADLHMERMTLAAVIDACTWDQGGTYWFCRPVSNFSFALNYWLGGLRPTGYHMVALMIHLIATLFVFKAILLLLAIDKTARPPADRLLIAGIAALLWAAHPMEIQAVTYIVQRMASLAAMFYIIGFWAWLKFRSAPAGQGARRPWRFVLLALLMVLLALGSKENAALFPAAMLLVEICFFDAAWLKWFSRRPKISVVLLLLLITGCLFWLSGSSLLNGYGDRPFDLKERLLTEPRILFFYLYQFLAPVPENFSIDHAVALSTSLFQPITTLFSMAGIAGIAVLSFLYKKRFPLVCFSVLFFFVHHLVESTVLSLELIFEHRNYLPAMFLFLPVALGINRLLVIYRQRSRFIFYIIAAVVTFSFVFIGMSTHVRNYDWQSPKALWQSAIVQAPDLTRPWHNLAWFYDRTGQTDRALDLYAVALEKTVHDNRFKKVWTLENMAGIYYQRENFEQAAAALTDALALIDSAGVDTPSSLQKKRYYVFKLCLVYAHTDPPRVIGLADRLLAEPGVGPATRSRLYSLKARVLLAQGHPEAALANLQQALALAPAPDKADIFLPLGVTFEVLKDSKKGLWFLNRYMAGRPDSGIGQLYLAENRLLAGDTAAAQAHMAAFISDKPLTQINGLIKEIQAHNPDLPPLVAPHRTLELLGRVAGNVITGFFGLSPTSSKKGVPCIP